MLNESVAAKRAIHRCCSSSQDTLHVPPEHRRFRRVNGLQLPLHPQQVTGWVLLVVVFVGTFTVLTTPPLPLLLLPDLRLALSFLYAALFLAHVFAHLTVLLLDPADPEVRARPASEVVPEFDRSKHRHVIENGRCHLCNITTRGRRTKHCSICNKCVPRFDHHCKWLNNCIGGRNYPAFLVCLVSTLVTALAVAGLALGELVLVHVRVVDWGGNNDTMNNATASSSLPVPGAGSLVLVTIIGVLSAIAAVLLIHLCFFHGYIACLGLTTYEYVRNKREKSSGAAAAAAAASRTSSSGPCGALHCAANEENVETVGARGLYRFCESGPPFRDGAATTTTMTTATTDVYVCSTHEERGDMANGSRDSLCSRLSSTRGNRNFRLCFSYDSRTTETSIEVSSRTTESGNHHGESPDAKSSTPSPVSCCFSIMNSPAEGGRHEKSANRNRRSSEHSETTKRSCGTMRRIQTFLQARLRKSSSRQRSTTSASAVARPCGNKIIPATDSPINVAPANEDQLVEQLTPTTELTSLPDPRPPVRLPALDLPSRAIHKIGVPAGDISVPGSIPVAMPKRNQTHLRTRRNTLSRKRPRFKIGSHITQTAQLSPIPESEFSKPATPRSPSRSDHFAFPSLRE